MCNLHKYLTAIIICLLFLAGCDREMAEQKIELENLRHQVEVLSEDNANLKSDIANMQIKEVSVTHSLRALELGTSKNFTLIEGVFVAPTPFSLEGSHADVGAARISVGTRFNLRLQGSWFVGSAGGKLELHHSEGISGVFRPVNIKELIPVNQMQTILSNYHKGFPGTTLTYRRLFLGGRQAGLLSQATVNIEGDYYELVVGFVQRGEHAILFKFLHGGSNIEREILTTYC